MLFDLKRRSILLSIAATSGLNACGGQPLASVASTDYSDSAAAEAWMNTWMASKLPVGTLHMSRFKDRVYFLTKTIGWRPNAGQEKLVKVDVPKGFVTDFASIPRIFWAVLPPDGDYTYPAIIHDYLYWFQITDRETADNILKAAMVDFKIDPVTIETIYKGVRLGGQSAWNENAHLKLLGEKRVLKKYPTDPTVSWPEWKKNSANF